MNHDAEWHLRRRGYLGGSDIAAVLGVSQWKTAIDVWEEKVGLVEPQEPNSDMERGLFLEEPFIKYYNEAQPTLAGVQAFSDRQVSVSGHTWYGGEVDGEIFVAERGGKGWGVFELKCPRPATISKYQVQGVPASYILQCQHYMIDPSFNWCRLVFFDVLNMDWLEFDLLPDKDIQDWILREGEKFWQYVVNEEKPDGYKPEPMEIPPLGKPAELKGDEWQQIIGGLVETDRERKTTSAADRAAQKEFNIFKEEAKVLMGDEQAGAGFGGYVTYKWEGSEDKPKRVFRFKEVGE